MLTGWSATLATWITVSRPFAGSTSILGKTSRAAGRSVATWHESRSTQRPVWPAAVAAQASTRAAAAMPILPVIASFLSSPRRISELSWNVDHVDDLAPRARLEETALGLQVPGGARAHSRVVGVRLLGHAENTAAGGDR